MATVQPQNRDSPNLMANQGIAMKNQITKSSNLTSNIQQNPQPLSSSQTIKTDQTIGGNNYFMKNPNQQGQQNALVGTGAVAGIKEQNLPTLNQPQGEEKNINKGQVLKARNRFKKNGVEYYCPTPTPENPDPEPVPVKTTPTPTKQPTPQPQQTQEQPQPQPVEEPQEPTIEEPEVQEEVQETPTEQPQEETPTELATIEGENKEGLIYGRASGESQQTIHTNADQYSADQSIQAERQKSLNNLQGMNSYNVAVSIANGYTPMGEQAMRDLQQYDPQKYNEIQEHLKTIQKGEIANQIATNGKIDITGQIKTTTDTINNDIDNRAKKNSTPESYASTLSSLTDKLTSSQTAQTATQEMLNINKDIAEIQEQMNNLPNEAKKVFKGDVPQYLVDAYISNKSQELQSKLNKLQSRYQSATDLYKTEVAQKQWETEMEFKNRQFLADQTWKEFDYNFKMQQQNRENNFKTNQFNRQVGQQSRENTFKQNQFDRQMGQQDFKNQLDLQQFQLSSIKTDSLGRPYQLNQDGTYTYLQDNTAQMLLNQQRQNAVATLMATKHDGEWGGQCEAFTNRYLEQVYGTKFQGKNGYTTAQEKIGYVNTNEPVIGSIAIFDYGITDKVTGENYGHTMVVTGYDPNTGTVTLKGSNKSSKPNEKEKIYTSTVNISQLNGGALKGFYDPLLDRELDNNTVVDDTDKGYGWNQMSDAFENLISSAKSDSSRQGVATTERLYGTLQELRDNGALYELINSGDLGKIVAQMNQQQFGNDDGSQFQMELSKILGNTKLGLSEKSKIALNSFYTLVESKLRKESGAAISSSEWMSNFQMMLPQSNESVELQTSKLKNRDKLMYSWLRSAGISQKDYIPLFEGELPTGLEEQLEDIINDNRKTSTTGKKFDPSRR